MCLTLVGLALRGSGRGGIEHMSVQAWREHATVVRNHHTLQRKAEEAGRVSGFRASFLWACCSRSRDVVLHHELRMLFLLTRGLSPRFHFLTCVPPPRERWRGVCVWESAHAHRRAFVPRHAVWCCELASGA